MLDDLMMFVPVLSSKDNQFFIPSVSYSELEESTNCRNHCRNTLEMCNSEDKLILGIEHDVKDWSDKASDSEAGGHTLLCDSSYMTRSVTKDSIEDTDSRDTCGNEVIKTCQGDAVLGESCIQRGKVEEYCKFSSGDISRTSALQATEVGENEVVKSCQADEIARGFSEKDMSSDWESENISNSSTIGTVSSRIENSVIFLESEGLMNTNKAKDRGEEKEEPMMVSQSSIGEEVVKDVSVIDLRHDEEKSVHVMVENVDINKEVFAGVSVLDTSTAKEEKGQRTLGQEDIDERFVKDIPLVETIKTYVPFDDFNKTNTTTTTEMNSSIEMLRSEAEDEIKEHAYEASTSNNVSISTPSSKDAMESSRSLRSLLSLDDYYFPMKDDHASTSSIGVKAIETSNNYVSSTSGSNTGINNQRHDSYSFPEKWYEDADEDEFLSGPIAFSGALTHPGLTCSYSAQVPHSGSISHRSDSSISGRSFAFPILASEWNSSPVKMGDSDENLLLGRKPKFWQRCFCCQRSSSTSSD